MANYPYGRPGTELDLFRDALIQFMIDAEGDFKSLADINTSFQNQINTLVLEGSIDPETAQARVDAAGVIFATIKERMDTKETEFLELLAQAATKTELENVLNGSPQGVYTTLAGLQSAYPTGAPGVFVVSADGHIYSWNGSAWTDRGLYQAVTLADGSVTGAKLGAGTLKLIPGKNLFNKATAIPDKYVDSTDGILKLASPDPTKYIASDWIAVTALTAYFNSNPHHIAFYNSSKAYISGLIAQATFTTPANCAYVRISVATVSKDVAQLELNSVKTEYEPFVYKINPIEGNVPLKIVPGANSVGAAELKSLSVTTSKIAPGAVTTDKTTFILPGKNLINKDDVTAGYYVIDTTGELGANVNYNASNFIPITPETAYFITYNRYLAFYTAAGVFISGLEGDGLGVQAANNFSFITPVNAYLIRVSISIGVADTTQLEIGTEFTGFEPYGKYLDPQYLNGTGTPAADEVLIFLPSEICIAVGRTIELYNSQVFWSGNLNNYHFKWNCSVGSAMKRKWSCLGVTAKIGSYPLTLTVHDNNMQVIATATTTIKIVSSTMATTKKLLTIGDSLTNTKPWLAELEILSASKIVQVGTRGTGTLMQEGRSGFSAASYLAATAYAYQSEGVHPFWNPNTLSFDYAYYKTQTGVNPDAIQIYLGTNGMVLDPTSNATNIKTIVDKIREVDAVIPIHVVFTLFRGDQNGMGKQLSSDGYSAGSGVWKLEEDRKVFNLMVKVNDLLKTYTNLNFVPIALAHDSEYNFGSAQMLVNPRATQTEPQAVEATHPQAQGYYQMADIMYSVLAKIWGS